MSQRRIWLVALLFFSGVCIAGWVLVSARDRAETIEESQRSLTSTLRLLEQLAKRALVDGDALLETIAEEFETLPERNSKSLGALTVEISSSTDMVGAVSAAWIVDAQGNVVAESWGYPPPTRESVADREYFREHRAGEEGVHLGPMEVERLTGRPRFTMSRRISDEEGRFEGVAVIGVYSDYFVDAFRDADLGVGSSLILARSDGTVLARWGDAPVSPIGASNPTAGLPVDVAPALDIEVALANFPVVVSASRRIGVVLEQWRLRTLQTGGLTLALVAGFFGLTLLGQRAVREEEQARAALVAANRSLEERIEARTADLTATARQMCLITNAIPAAIAFVDKSERYVFVNSGHWAVWPRSGEDVVGKSVGEVVGELAHRRLKEHIAGALRGEKREFELELPPLDEGLPRTIQATYVPNVRADGTVDGFFALLIDVTARKADEERLRLLIGELDHRVRNTLAMILSMITHAARGPETKEAFALDLRERIRALGRTQSLLTQSRWFGAELRAIVEQELTPHGPDGRRFEIEGPSLVLAPKPALSLGLLLHELATNAAKYGALSVPEGRVHVRWRLLGSGQETELQIEWRESGGPPVTAPTRKGFGTLLVERAIGYELGSEASIEFPVDGVVCRLTMPAGRIVVRSVEPGPAAAEVAERARDGLRTGPVLVVEDDALIAFDTIDALRALGHAVSGPCAKVADALALVEREAPAFALLDVNLGEETSFPIAERLAILGIPYAFVTGYDARIVIPAAYTDIPLLQKPTTREEIGALVARYVSASSEPAQTSTDVA